MLDTITKRRIDTARDILVGKVPDPKSQVEQITIALIYKFMDDMDAQGEEMGGGRKFFAGDFSKFGWKKIMAPNMGGQDILNLYSEAITRMNENAGIPPLFRDIFKNAYLPYRDPETLKSFLKIIDDFEYDHSEKLGDAFEYLLSVLGSQGDAGQFRTPRNIIDFMIEAIDPKKNESILDPACGTAGFLISAYKHILKHNSSNFTPEKDQAAFTETNASINELIIGGVIQNSGHYQGDKLNPDDKSKIAQNFKGYDISPDMVRLSLVNLYLHGFIDPHIYEYDTLTSEDRWNEYADIILANPPFMSPKGGIKPHKRFSIDAKRSEVLFVDYIAEHLTPKGRAAVIVPEGIIFQSGTAYKALRKMLVENYLFAVVSLPAGVFNPYSGVKTSILLIDKTIAKKSDSILFVKIENDGFDLGAQRRPIQKNDLPEALRVIREYVRTTDLADESDLTDKSGPGNLNQRDQFNQPKSAVQTVTKKQIAENGDYNLSGERYRPVDATRGPAKWPMVKLGDVCEPEYGYTISAKDNGDARLIRITDINANGQLIKDEIKYADLTEESKKYLLKKRDLLVARTGATYGKTMLFNEDYPAIFASFLIRLNFNENVLPEYYWSFAQSEHYWTQAQSLMTGGGQPQFNGNALKQIKFPLPPLEVQKEIVAEIEGYQIQIENLKSEINNLEKKISNKISDVWTSE
jgi:type I restriction enzyme M protein